MTRQAEELTHAVLKLSREERAELMDCLAASLSPVDDEQHLDAWLDVAQRRLDDITTGKTTTVPAEEAMEKVRAVLRR